MYGEELDEGVKFYNFNDYYHTFTTLLNTMLTGYGDYFKITSIRIGKSWWNNIYFISFFLITNCIFLNILIGMICESTAALLNNN